MSNKLLWLESNVGLRLEDLGDGTFKVSVKQVTQGALMGSRDVALAVLGINVPIWLVSNLDGPAGGFDTFSLAVSTPVTPIPTKDIAASILGGNIPIRLVWIASAGVYALGVSIH